jgi:rhodanese-related sulfurtransferase
MELAYSPQYGSAKDPVNMAGFVAGGLLRGDHPQVSVEQLREAASRSGEDRPLLVDVRTADESRQGHIAGARNIPVDELRDRLQEVPRDRPVVVYCQVGQRGYLATRMLVQKGYDASNLSGGFKALQMFGHS